MNTRKAPLLVQQEKGLLTNRFGQIPLYGIQYASKVLSAPAYRLFIAYASCGKGFHPPGIWLKDHASIQSKKIYLYRNEMEAKGFLHHENGVTTILWPNILRLSIENNKASEETLPPTEGEILPPQDGGIKYSTYSKEEYPLPYIPKIRELSKGKYRYISGKKPEGSYHQEQVMGNLTEAEYKYMVEELSEYISLPA